MPPLNPASFFILNNRHLSTVCINTYNSSLSKISFNIQTKKLNKRIQFFFEINQKKKRKIQNYSISTWFGSFRVLSSKQLITYGHFQMVYSFENDVTLVSRVHIFRAPCSSFILPLDRPERTIVSEWRSARTIEKEESTFARELSKQWHACGRTWTRTSTELFAETLSPPHSFER